MDSEIKRFGRCYRDWENTDTRSISRSPPDLLSYIEVVYTLPIILSFLPNAAKPINPMVHFN